MIDEPPPAHPALTAARPSHFGFVLRVLAAAVTAVIVLGALGFFISDDLGQRTKAQNLSERLNSDQAAYGVDQQAIAAMQSQLATLQSQDAADQQEIEPLQSQNAADKQQVAALQSQNSTDQQEIAALQSQNSADAAEIQSLLCSATTHAFSSTICG